MAIENRRKLSLVSFPRGILCPLMGRSGLTIRVSDRWTYSVGATVFGNLVCMARSRKVSGNSGAV
jgi:hypothetical protein